MLNWLWNMLFVAVWMSSCSHYHSFMSMLFSVFETTLPHKTIYRIKYSPNKVKPTISKAGNTHPPNSTLKVRNEYFHSYLFTEYPKIMKNSPLSISSEEVVWFGCHNLYSSQEGSYGRRQHFANPQLARFNTAALKQLHPATGPAVLKAFLAVCVFLSMNVHPEIISLWSQ